MLKKRSKKKNKRKTFNQPTHQGHIYIYYIPQDHIQKRYAKVKKKKHIVSKKFVHIYNQFAVSIKNNNNNNYKIIY